MRRILVSLCLLAVLPATATAFDTNAESDLLSYVAMPLAVSAVCDVPGVQTDRVGRLVVYMDQANVPPDDFIDAFRYVPVALELRTDGRPDFVEWVGAQVDQGIVGPQLVTVMERQLRTYDDYVPAVAVVSERTSRRARRYYSYAYEDDYVPVVIRRHCERQMLDPMSLIDMPVAVARVCDLGNIPYDRVSSLVIELNLGGVPAVQFVELMRYAPAGLAGGYGQPDFVDFVRAQRVAGINGFGLVRSADQRLRAYDVAPQIDVVAPQYTARNYYVAAPAQNYVAPVDSRFVPAVVQTRISRFATSRIQSPPPAPAVAAAPQVERLLGARGSAVVVNPAQARRELAQQDRARREAPVTAPAPGPGTAPGFGVARAGSQRGPAPFVANPVNAAPRETDRARERVDRGRRVETPGAVAAPQPAPVVAAAPRGHSREQGASPGTAPQPRPAIVAAPRGQGRERHIAAPTVAAPVAVAPPARNDGNGRGHAGGAPPNAGAPVPAPAAVTGPGRGRGNGHEQRQAAPAPAPAPVPVAAPAAVPPPGEQRGGHGRPGGPPAGRGPAAAAPTAVPTAVPAAVPAGAAPAPAPAPPPNKGQEKKKEKEKGKDQ